MHIRLANILREYRDNIEHIVLCEIKNNETPYVIGAVLEDGYIENTDYFFNEEQALNSFNRALKKILEEV